MNIVIYVNYSDKEFNKDFAISNVLLKEHNIFLAINEEQLNSLYASCDIMFRGLSAKNIDLHSYSFIDLNEDSYLEDIKKYSV